jgi:4-hydroxymandelate oxidase
VEQRRYLEMSELAQVAKDKLDPATYAYFASGADEEQTLADNAAAWRALRLRPRCLVGVSRRSLATTLLGQPVQMPVVVAPMAFQGLAHASAELGMVEAANDAGVAFCLSTLANTSMEQVRASAQVPVWFQLYVVRDRARTASVVQRAQAAGCGALVVTVDTPVLGRRHADARSGFVLPPHLALPNLPVSGALLGQHLDARSALARFASEVLDPGLTWRDLEALAASTTLPVVVKGVLRADDARRAVEHGARGVIVSNHGGRQLDGAVPTAWALPEVVEAVGQQAEVYVDGGIRSGTDVLRALALGARAVLLGRAVLWGLSADGPTGARWVLDQLRDELDRAMALCGCASVQDCSADLLWRR